MTWWVALGLATGLSMVLALPAAAEPPTIDRILVEKHARRMSLLDQGRIVRTYTVALGAEPLGHKQRQGDERTPEGRYRIVARNPDSAYHRSLRISYPNDDDRERAHTQGVDPGGDIMIHGLPNGWGWLGGLHRWLDWTDGCIAVTNSEMDQIWELVATGTPIDIEP